MIAGQLWAFLQQHGVQLTQEGKNVKRGEQNISCPFCPDGDPHAHLGITEDGRWSCWRCKSSGKRPHRLLRALRLSADEFIDEVESGPVLGVQDLRKKLSTHFERRRSAPSAGKTVAPIRFPDTFLPVVKSEGPRGTAARYIARWLNINQAEAVRWAARTDLRVCLAGRFSGRLIFPLRWKGELLGWTGRALAPNRLPKYLTEDGGRPVLYCPRPIICGAPGVLVEGPRDAARLAHADPSHRVNVVATLGAAVTGKRASMLAGCRCSVWWTIRDDDAAGRAWEKGVAFLSPLRLSLPDGAGDAGELSTEQAAALLKKVTVGA